MREFHGMTLDVAYKNIIDHKRVDEFYHLLVMILGSSLCNNLKKSTIPIKSQRGSRLCNLFSAHAIFLCHRLQHALRDGTIPEVKLRHLGAADGNTVIAKNVRYETWNLCSSVPPLQPKLVSVKLGEHSGS